MRGRATPTVGGDYTSAILRMRDIRLASCQYSSHREKNSIFLSSYRREKLIRLPFQRCPGLLSAARQPLLAARLDLLQQRVQPRLAQPDPADAGLGLIPTANNNLQGPITTANNNLQSRCRIYWRLSGPKLGLRYRHSSHPPPPTMKPLPHLPLATPQV